jgi:hypothetical protein
MKFSSLARAGLTVVGVLTLALAARPMFAQEKAAAKADAKADDKDLQVVEIKLPKPAYAGTPKNLPANMPNLEKPTGKPREPWKAPKGTTLLSNKKPVTSSDKEPIIGQLDMITDGDKEGADGSWVELGPGLQWVQIDLKQSAAINGIILWHHHGDPRVYKDVIVQVSDDGDFINDVKTVYNNDHDNSAGLGIGKDKEYFENYEGRLIKVDAVKGRYVRCYSKGSTSDDQNHYTEVEVYGIAAK